jgi:predicted Ser/Thr protein kinase
MPTSQQLALANEMQLHEFSNRNKSNKGFADALKIARNADFQVDPSELADRELIGSGNFSEVYRAYWRGCKVALKVLKQGQNLSREVLTLK